MSKNGFASTQRPGDSASEWNALMFMVRSLLRRMSTATLVKVMAVTNDGGVSPVGFVDVLPLVNMLDGAGVAVPHGTIHHCVYMRAQGGANAIILDPQVGDIGIAVFADRDISSVMATKAQANPGSRRRFDMADGMYLGGTLNGTPTQFVQFSSGGIRISSPAAINMDAPTIQLDCDTFTLNATTSATANTPTFTFNGDVVNNGNVHTTGDTLTDGAATVTGAATLSTTLQVNGAAGFAAALVDQRTGKDIGGTHIHDHGTMTGSGHSGVVI